MLRKVLVLVVTLVLSAVAPSVQAAQPMPAGSHAFGHSHRQWLRMVGQFYLGDASNPLLAGLQQGDCGALRGRVYYMVAPIDVGMDLDCHVKVGTPIVFAPAAYFTTAGVDGDTDAELEAAARAGFVTMVDRVTLDGRDLALHTTDTGAYDVVSEPGGFYDAVLGLGTGRIRTVIRGNLVLLHPLRPGDHVLTATVSFANGDQYSATYHLHVGHQHRSRQTAH
jgi:hypothetical protein